MDTRNIEKYLERNKKRKKWISAVTVLGVIASMFTNALLTNPADAMAGALICSQEEHTHTNECYITMPVHVGCTENTQEQHLHDQTCYDAEGKLVCNKEEYVIIHTHDSNCYDKDGNLICSLPEVEEHIHDASCYDAEGHFICGKREIKEHREHTEECYTTNEAGERVLTCTYPIAIRHQHAMACYDQTEAVLICGKEEHVHTDSCYEQIEEEPVQEEVTEEVPEETIAEEEIQPETAAEETAVEQTPAEETITEDIPEEVTEEVPADSAAETAEAIPTETVTEEPTAEVQTETIEETITEENTEEAPAEAVTEETEEQQPAAEEIQTEIDKPAEEVQPEAVIEGSTEPAPTVIEEDGKRIVFTEEPAETEEESKEEVTEDKKPEEPSEEKKDEEVKEEEKSEEEHTKDTEDKKEEETEETPQMPAVSFENADTDVVVTVTAEEGSFPAGTTMKVVPVAAEEVTDAVQSTTEKSVVEIQAVDISFWYQEEEIEPLKAINVVMKPKAVTAEADHTAVVHVKDEGETEVVVEETEGVQEEVTFDTPEFSVYAIVYTVDFEYSMNGKMYQFSLPGGGFVSFTDLVEMLGITGDTNSDKNGDENGAEIADNAKENDANEEIEENGLNSDTNTPLTLGDGEVSEATRKFVADVESVAFSSPELVWVGKISEAGTVGELKETNGLEVEYSAELTKEQIAEINAQTVEAGDWALISVHPFMSEETLTVTMKNGEQFVVKVTDAQISTNVLTADGEHFRITVNYEDDANIPKGSVLVAEEIPEGSEKYEKYLKEALEKWEQDNKEGYISFCRFFDIEIQKNGKKVEPETAVEVEIVHEDGLAFFDDEELSVIHFAQNGTEIIEEIQRNKNNTEVIYEQEGFSVIGTISNVKNSGWPTNNGQHVLILQDGDTYYALKHDGTLTKVRYFNETVSFIGEGTTTTDYINDYLWYVTSNQGSNATGRVSDAPYSQGDDTTGISFICPTETGWKINTARQIRMDAGSHKLYYSSNYVARTLSADNGELSVVPINSENASPLYFANASTFSANSNETDLFTQEEVDSIISMWQSQMTKGFSTDKTAEVHDYENRVYRIDITASSADREISPSIALEFVVDASRSMFFPTSITEAGSLNGSNINAVTNWLNQNGDKNQTYFVISDPNGSATQYAFFYNPQETKHWYNQGGWKYYEGDPYGTWEWVDASNYNPPDGAKVIGNIPDRFPYSNLDGKIYTTEINNFTVDSEYGRRGNYVSRIEYLKQCVRVASQVIYSVDDNAQIGLIGFNKNITDYGTYGKDQMATLLDKVDKISLDGQTNQEGGLAKAVSKFQDPANADKYNNHKHVVVLVTDGAPNYTYVGDHKVTWETIRAVASQLKGLEDSFGNKTELYTMGLSLGNVGENQSGLFSVSSGIGYQYSAENAMEIVDAVTQMIEGVFVQANLVGDVTDVIDPAFYPVDKASGRPLSEGDWIDIDGNRVDENSTDKAGQISREGDQWKVTWTDQSIDWPTMENGNVTESGWHGTVFVKAKEDFLGGRGISTNSSGSQITAKKWKEQGSDVLHDLSAGEHVTPLEVPYVNVDELDFTHNDTVWTVYLGTEVDPLKELQALWNKVNVKEVVTKSDSDDHRMSVDGDLTYSYSQDATDNRTEVNARNEFPITSLAGVELTEDDWADLIGGKIKYIDYSAYGHEQVGTISIGLVPTVKNGEAGLIPSPHATTVTGQEVEKYVLSVWYTPKSASVSDWHTGSNGTGSRGVNTGNIRRANSHIINVFVKGLQITKVDLNDQPLIGAKFALYRTARSGETDLLEINGGQYHKVAELDTSSNGIAIKDQIEQLNTGEQYYLVETEVPAGYNGISPIPVNLNISDIYTPKPGATTQTTKPDSGIYDWTQNASLVLNAESGVKRTNADNTAVLTHSAVTANSNMETIYYRITNNPGVELPSTGGPGTRIFTILGSILVLGAGVLLWRRRRMI